METILGQIYWRLSQYLQPLRLSKHGDQVTGWTTVESEVDSRQKWRFSLQYRVHTGSGGLSTLP
jgi:hypothetical protein